MRYSRKTRKPYDQRLAEQRDFYDTHPEAKLDTKWAVIQLYHRHGLSLSDTADILGIDTVHVEFALAIIEQDAQ